MNSALNVEPRFACPYCDKQAFSRKFMRMHIASVHADAPIPSELDDAPPSLAVLAFTLLLARAAERKGVSALE